MILTAPVIHKTFLPSVSNFQTIYFDSDTGAEIKNKTRRIAKWIDVLMGSEKSEVKFVFSFGEKRVMKLDAVC